MASTSTIRLGPTDDNPSAHLLQKAITAFFENKNADHSSNGDTDSGFVIRNKYFSADISLKGIGMETNGAQDETAASTIEDGVILVFDAVQSNPDCCRDQPNAGAIATFDSLHATHQRAISDHTCGDLLRLCVGVSLSELSPSELRGKDHEKEYSRRILWCLDNGYEYIEADLSEEGQQKGRDDRDKDGFARVIEAIEGTVWSSAAMSASKSSTLKTTYADGKSAVDKSAPPAATKSCKGEETIETKPEGSGYEPPVAPPVAAAKSDNAASVFGLKEEMPALDPEDQVTEKLFVEMESVLKEASEIRQASKSGVLTDDERRERAGNAALALVNLMGQFGLDEEDDDSYGSDGSMVE